MVLIFELSDAFQLPRQIWPSEAYSQYGRIPAVLYNDFRVTHRFDNSYLWIL